LGPPAYRLEVTVAYRTGVVVIDWIGTHRAYDERNKRRWGAQWRG
jgi:mRNA-degrading endonuclease HigB of HigAB toxin-antitoxin module